MTTTKAAGATGPEKLLHQDHDSVQEALHGAAASEEGLVAGAKARLADVGDRVSGAASDARDWASDTYETGVRRASEYGRQVNDRVGEHRETVTTFAQENPLLVGVVGLAAGLLLGALLPRTRQEDRALGEWSDGVRDQGLRYAREATSRGRAYVEDTLASAGGDEPSTDTPARQYTGERSGPSGRYQNH